jgi:hypothetical protein
LTPTCGACFDIGLLPNELLTMHWIDDESGLRTVYLVILEATIRRTSRSTTLRARLLALQELRRDAAA